MAFDQYMEKSLLQDGKPCFQDQKGSVQPCVYGAQILKYCDELFIRLLRSVNFVIIRSNIIKSLAFTVLLVSLSASSVLFHYWAHHFHVRLKRFS